ncbi:hypothetical protein [Paenibacillus sp. 453mf]|uniref:hypothetical protein n=1 Tax=Paenibacillus sp. 453mf TaxID=1761874 RepID=UPI0008E0CE00|nr:hypothetical protein [Paenibacillus sp. 453mf]SFS76233.1 hypothetical protein SAMN04488601_10349 [Paenibacillus sp. 453mf]
MVNEQYQTKINFGDGIVITYGDSVSRQWIKFMAPLIHADEVKRRKRGGNYRDT